MDFTQLVTGYQVPVIVIICAIIGYLVKNTIPLDNKYIPTIVAVLGLGLSFWINGALTPETIASGLASGLASTGLHQFVKTWLDGLSSSSSNTDTSAKG